MRNTRNRGIYTDMNTGCVYIAGGVYTFKRVTVMYIACC